MKRLVKFICIIGIILCLIFLSSILFRSEFFKDIFLTKGLSIKNLDNAKFDGENVYASLETNESIFYKDLWCIATEFNITPSLDDDWQQIIDNKCNIKIDNTDKYIYIRNKDKIGEPTLISDYISSIVDISPTVKENLKLIKDETKALDVIIRTVGSPDTSITYVSDDENVAKIEDNTIIAVNDGSTKITISDNYGNSKAINVDVTSLITLPQINNKKPYLKYKQYTQEEAKILDEYLAYQISEAGDNTRAGVVAAARFLSLEFKQRVPYFLENGRITHFNHKRPYCDGEGRYYHKGLYLSTDKYADIEKSVAGPIMWGGYIKEWSTDNGIMPNGLDCSGFVCWCLYNGGFDLGDIGGGLSEDGVPTLSDIGIMKRIKMDLLESGTVKAGDLVMYDGHIGIIIGIDDSSVTVAETLHHGIGIYVTKFTYKGLVNSDFTHIIDMSEQYKVDGNYTAMWE